MLVINVIECYIFYMTALISRVGKQRQGRKNCEFGSFTSEAVVEKSRAAYNFAFFVMPL